MSGRMIGAAVLVLLSVAGCSRSDDDRTDIIDVDGVTCAVARDNIGRIKALSCDWGDQ